MAPKASSTSSIPNPTRTPSIPPSTNSQSSAYRKPSPVSLRQSASIRPICPLSLR
jgi:hypothetical protein